MSARQIEGKVTVGRPPPSSSEEWTCFQFFIHDFSNLSTSTEHYIKSPVFTCNGHQWELWIFPGGDSTLTEGKLSVYLYHLSKEAITTGFGLKLLDKFGNEKKSLSTKHEFTATSKPRGWPNFGGISRSDILDESKNILDSNGTLTIVFSMEEEPTTAFVPKNPLVKMVKDKFNDEATADVCFEVVSTAEGNDDDAKRVKTTTPFYAHRFILETCAPMLAAICGTNSGGVVTASVKDIKPEIFHYLLFYLYGGSISKEELKADAKDIIDAADKYSIVNLKLEAEVAYVESTDINLENAMDNLLYADSMNLALLKEAVMNFLAENNREAAANISFTDFPAHVVKDLLIAFSSYSKKGTSGASVDDLTTLSVSALRRKLDKMGEDLDIDGSREAMIESIKSHS